MNPAIKAVGNLLAAGVSGFFRANPEVGSAEPDLMTNPTNPQPEALTMYSQTVAIGPGDFPVTRWTLIVTAVDPTHPDNKAALATLCEGYWYPLYAFVRRKGYAADAARDLTQEFFVRLLGGSFFERADPEKGRFRSFLLGALKHFLADYSDAQRAQKRGGGLPPLPFELSEGESRYAREPQHGETPERIYERRWARAVLDRVVGTLREEFVKHGRLDHFNHLKVYLTSQGDAPYAELAKKLDMSESALKSGIHRLRRRYRDMLRAEVAATVADPADIDTELRYLLAALSAKPGA